MKIDLLFYKSIWRLGLEQFQGTVTGPIKFVGVGLHSNELVNLEIIPLGPNSGIYFQRLDLVGAKPIKASTENITSTELCTKIGYGENTVSTIEHLMAAFYGVGVDNALVRVNNIEIPILDGSSAPFVDKLSCSGVQIQHIPRKKIKLKSPIEVVSKEQSLRYYPHQDLNNDKLRIRYSIDFKSKAIGRQSLLVELDASSFLKICEARTFCHIDEVNFMRSRGLALGGSFENAIVVDNDKVLNSEGLRIEEEFVRHKILDFVGDIALLPGRLSGEIHIVRGGHALHSLFTKKVASLLYSPLIERMDDKDVTVFNYGS